MAGDLIDQGDLWKDKVRALQLRIRDRFRVTVDRHRRKPRFSNGYFSSSLQRWVIRLQNLRKDSLPASSAFYRKRVNKEIDAVEDSIIIRMLQALAVPVIGNVCHVFMHGLNHIQIYGADKLHQALLYRPEGKPLVTGLDMALSKLNNGGWVHIFPEGTRSRDGGKTMGSAKRGVGRLVMDADIVPMVVPFVHTGMQEIMPIGANFPRIGKTVTVLIGDPIHFDDLLFTVDDAQQLSRGTLYDAMSSRIDHSLRELKVQVDRLALEQSLQAQDYSLRNEERANGILQQVDWEAFGMASYILTEDHYSLRPAIQNQPELNIDQASLPTTSNQPFSMGFSSEGGIVSRIRGYMDPTELMGFAARGLFMNSRIQKENSLSIGKFGPLKVWKQFVEANILQQWNSC